MSEERLHQGARLLNEVLNPMKSTFVGKDEIIDLLGICLVGGENLFLLGPPGTAKSALVHNLSARLQGQTFDYLLTRFTEPNELFGPFDIRKLREGELVTNTEGMLPEASLVFLDELLNANSAILNSLLMVLNERLFRRGRETRAVKALMFVGASNHTPEDDALKALFDRFLLRVHCDNVEEGRLSEVLHAGWQLETSRPQVSSFGFDDVEQLQSLLRSVDLGPVHQRYVEVVHRIRQAGIPVSDRRAVKLQSAIAASAIVSGRLEARVSDLWVLRYTWETEEQQEVLRELVEQTLRDLEMNEGDHPRARQGDEPDAEELARELAAIDDQIQRPESSSEERLFFRDRLAILDGRCQWVTDPDRREFLTSRASALWNKLTEIG
jgi:MoxR-like ATPase